MKGCELCGVSARMYCESDHASLCWECDEKVHGANFLVAKHLRVLLCHVCQSQTPWSSSGAKLTPTVSVCESCVGSRSKIDLNEEPESEAENEEEEYYDDEDEDEDEEVDEVEDEDEEEENQVVPWSCCSYLPAQPPLTASGSDSEAETSNSVSKRLRENYVDVDYSEDEVGYDGTASFGSSLRPSKRPKLGEERNGDGYDGAESKWRATTILSSIQRLENEVIVGGDHASTAVLRICRLSRDE